MRSCLIGPLHTLHQGRQGLAVSELGQRPDDERTYLRSFA